MPGWRLTSTVLANGMSSDMCYIGKSSKTYRSFALDRSFGWTPDALLEPVLKARKISHYQVESLCSL